MTICYSGKSAPSARVIAAQSDDIEIVRSNTAEINWGRARANTSLNPDISNATNKRRMRQLFSEHEVPMPRLFSLDEARLHILRGGTVIGRPDTHSKGRGLWRCNSLSQLSRALRGTRRKKAATHFMEYIDAPREYRVHIFKGRSIRISEKEHGVSGITAHGNYVTKKPTHDVRQVRRAAKQAVAALGLDFGAVDILANDEQVWTLEVNSAPGLGGTMPRVYADTFRRWLEGEWDGCE